MSRQNLGENLQNGIPPQWGAGPGPLPQKVGNFAPLNNGVGSSQSSRDSSPASRYCSGQPPPPNRGPNSNSATPHSSPRIPPFCTSTPTVVPSSLPQRNSPQNLPNSGLKQSLNKPEGQMPVTGAQPLLNTSGRTQESVTQFSGSSTSGAQFLQQQNVSEHTEEKTSSMQYVVHPEAQLQGRPSFPVQSAPNSNRFHVGNAVVSSGTGAHFLQQNSAEQTQYSGVPPQVPILQTIPNANRFHAGNVAVSGAQTQEKAPPQLRPSVPVQTAPSFAQNSNLQEKPVFNQYAVSSGAPAQYVASSGALPQPVRISNLPPVGINSSPVASTNVAAAPRGPYSAPSSTLHTKRYPVNPYQQTYMQQQQQPQPQQPPNNMVMYQQQQQQGNYGVYPGANYAQNMNLTQQMSNLSVVKGGFNKLWGHENLDLLQCTNVLPEEGVEPPKVRLGQEFLDAANCSPEIFRCTMTKIPENNSLLQKSRLPLGVLIHPFKDLNHLPVIQCSTIVRCRACRTYINPFIFFVDTKRWKCNLCYRVNELPEEFQYDPVSKSYGDPSRRPEIKSSTIEYIAPSEYMLRPPQPAVYLFLLDISRTALESGYLQTVCSVLSSQLTHLPGDARTQIGFIAYNSTLRFFSLAEGLSRPHEMCVTDIDDVFLPCPDNLLVNLKEHMDLVSDLLSQLPTRYQDSYDNGCALGAALQAALKLMSGTGGRVSVFQTCLPSVGAGALAVREDPNQRAGKEVPHLNPATDFYKRLALDCSGHQIAVDLFLLNSQYIDIATLSGISRFSGGCMYHFPLFNKLRKSADVELALERCFHRYLTRKIGFEAVMRIRCTRGLSIHTFHGNFFVRSTDLLSLPNVNPDSGFGMQVSIEESLADLQTVCFQAALLYTSSKGERRIRVHTLCLPVVSTLPDLLNAADQQCIVGLLSKMAVDRSLQSSLSDARDAFINVAIDVLASYRVSLNMGSATSGLLAPHTLQLLPLYILALLKYTAFRTGQSTRLDDRVFAMCEMKTLPLAQLMQNVYPDLYPIYRLSECPMVADANEAPVPQPRRLQLTSRNIDSHGAYLLDAGQQMMIFVCQNVSQSFLVHTLGVSSFNSLSDQCYELPKLEHTDNQQLHAFINRLNDEKPYPASMHIMRENSLSRSEFLERLIEDRIEFALSYNEFLQHLKTQVK